MKRAVLLESLTFGLDLIDSAARELDLEVVLLAGAKGLYGDLSHLQRIKVREIDTRNDATIHKELLALKPDALVSNTDTWMISGAKHSEWLGLPGRSVQFSNLIRHKHAVRSALGDSDVLHLEQEELGELDASSSSSQPELLYKTPDGRISSIPLPAIAKPDSGTGSHSVHILNNSDDVKQFMEQVFSAQPGPQGGWLFEPYTPGPLWSAEVFVYERIPTVLGFTGRVLSFEPYSREEALMFPALTNTALDKQARLWVADLLTRLGAEDGYYHVEFTYWNGNFALIEVNGRMGGSLICYALERGLEFNPYKPLLQLSLGLKPDLPRNLSPSRSYAAMLLYADQKGTITAFRTPSLSAYPGDIQLHFVKHVGERITRVDDQTGCYAHLSAVGDTAEEAYAYAQAAARSVKAVVS